MNMLLDCKFYPKKLNFWLLKYKIWLIYYFFKLFKLSGEINFQVKIGHFSVNGGKKQELKDVLVMTI